MLDERTCWYYEINRYDRLPSDVCGLLSERRIADHGRQTTDQGVARGATVDNPPVKGVAIDSPFTQGGLLYDRIGEKSKVWQKQYLLLKLLPQLSQESL